MLKFIVNEVSNIFSQGCVYIYIYIYIYTYVKFSNYVRMYTYKFSFCIFKTKARTGRYREGKIGTREVVEETTISKD